MKIDKIEMRVTPEFKSKVKARARARNLSVTVYLMELAVADMHNNHATEGAENAAKTHEHA
jgi:hypothetical protein